MKEKFAAQIFPRSRAFSSNGLGSRMLRWTTPLLLLYATLVTPAATAEENPGISAAPILQLAPSARAAGMGSAFTGTADDLGALYFNPAGLCGVDSHTVGFDYVKGLVDQDIEQISAASPLPFAGLFGGGYATIGAGALFSNNGSIEVNRTNADGSFRDSRTINAGSDLVASLAYSERIFENSVEVNGRAALLQHFLGTSAKFIRSTLAEEYSAHAFAGDLGYMVRARELGWQAGLAVQNAGTRMRFIEEGDPLPLTFRGGASYLFSMDRYEDPPAQALRLAADGDYLYYDKVWHAGLGVEYLFLRNYSLRLGYQLNRDVAGLAFGFGARWQDFSLDYAWGLNEALGDMHRFSLSWRFGRVSQHRREQAHRPYIESMPEREDLSDLEKKTPHPMEDSPRKPRRTIKNDDMLPGWIY
ncbi:MAG: PorV/PorQ family protein [Elusimicrobiota bacterium]|jgi:hypothetical protein